MFKLKRKMNVAFLSAALLAGATTFAQTTQLPQQQEQKIEVSDAELGKFAQAYQGIQVAEQEAQRKMIAAVEEQDLEIAKFNEIHQAKMQQQEITASEDEQKKHAKAVENIEKMQPEIQTEMERIITKEDLTVERFQQIATAMQQDPALQQRLQELMTQN